ncbi:unnamed protein product [Clonostachys rosea f. rosea IK726]|uniref:Peroxidase n=2 Tax=Bionectria ochroleuca TaxID=29856 RepID=A0A0B7KKA2_BIOOC|nr:unnamed protein product [Clonostachys rosea f. rosea IK726]
MKSLAITTLALAHSVAAGQLVWPSKWDELENLFTMMSGINRQGFIDSVNPCDFAQNEKGRHNSAQWLRTAFHDMVTHNAELGTGGVDASIFFELDRAENEGSAFSNTWGFFSGFHTVRSSAADLVALGVVTVSGACGGNKLQYRGGRIDATEAGPSGVPEAHTDLDTVLETFSKAGFTKEEMITMVACGHTLGGVHSVNSPEIVDIPADPSNDTLVTFQKDVSKINNGVVNEYLDGSTKNPLVVASNDTFNADKRVFSSDGNTTMTKMQDEKTFLNMCADIFNRMIDTVPSNVQLSDVIEPYEVKPYIGRLLLTEGGDITFTGSLRFRVTEGSGRNYNDIAADLIYYDRDGAQEHVVTAVKETYKLGLSIGLHGESFINFNFQTTVKGATGISKFTIRETTPSTNETVVYDNQGTGGYPVDDTVLYQLSDSCFDSGNIVDGMIPVSVIAMVREDEASKPLTLEVVHKKKRDVAVTPALEWETVNFESTGVKNNGWVEFKTATKVEGTTTFDIVLGGERRPTVEFLKTGPMPRTCTK